MILKFFFLLIGMNYIHVIFLAEIIIDDFVLKYNHKRF